MDSWEWNKIAGAVLGFLLFILALGFVAEAVFKVSPPQKPGYAVEVPENLEAPAAATAEALPDFAAVLPAADLAHGKDLFLRCQQCHVETKDGRGKIGPTLWGIVGRARASHPGFSYSTAMNAAHDPWTYDRLFVFLKAPSGEVPGTRMSYAGLRAAQDRTDLLAYLRTLDDTPAPIPAK